jgi:AmmeMemoRadiSam system protein A
LQNPGLCGRPTILCSDDQAALFTLARGAIRAHLVAEGEPALPADRPDLEAVRGVFVTLRKGEALRGCIGHTEARLPLAEAVRTLACSAAFRDRRFDPVRLDELPALLLEISVLTPLEPADTGRIDIGRHGLFVRDPDHAGILLPQVASERDWDPETFLRQTCRKAGLPQDAWRREDVEVLWFSCDIYHEPGT